MQLLCHIFSLSLTVFFQTQPNGIYLAHTVSWRGNYRVWRENYELALALSENDLALTSACPTEPVDPVREENESDVDFTARQRDHVEVRMKYDLERKKLDISNRKCLMVAKSIISNAIRGSISDCDTATEYIKKVESQFTGSSKTYASTLIKKLFNEKYTGGVSESTYWRWATRLRSWSQWIWGSRMSSWFIWFCFLAQRIWNFCCKLQNAAR